MLKKLNKYRGYSLGNIYPQHNNYFKKFILKIFSRKFLQMAKLEIIYSKLKLKQILTSKYIDINKEYLSIAPGNKTNINFINIDLYKYPGVDYQCDCRIKLPFRDESIKGIFTEHFVEHLDYIEEFPYFLLECFRILKSDGILRIITPDATKYFECYLKSNLQEMEKIRNVEPGYLFHQGIEHKFIFDYETLSLSCMNARFRKVYRYDYKKGQEPYLLLDSEHRKLESLYVEVTK